jgi:HEAT repeat protein
VLARAAEDERAAAGRGIAVSPHGLADYVIAPTLVDAAALALGETGDPQARAALEPMARDPASAGRWAAALALGGVPGSERTLLALLGDERDGFVRYLAFLGLRARTGEEAFAD